MNKRVRLTLLLGLALALAAPGGWDLSEAQKKGSKVRIIEEKGPAGHKTIGIDESSLGEEVGKELALTFSTLMTWEYEAKKNPPRPRA